MPKYTVAKAYQSDSVIEADSFEMCGQDVTFWRHQIPGDEPIKGTGCVAFYADVLSVVKEGVEIAAPEPDPEALPF